MTIILRPYQKRGIEEISDHFRAGYKTALYNLATGGGKTITAGSIIHRTQQKGKKCLFLCNRIELVDQTVKAFESLGIRSGIIAAGYKHDDSPLVQIGSIDTVRSRLDSISFAPDLVVWDECRGIHAPSWRKIYHHYEDAFHLGLDATPERADGKPLSDFFSVIIKGPTVQELITMGSLVAPLVYAPNAPDLTGISTRFGDYEIDALANAMNKPKITGSAIEWYQKIGDNRSGIVFCVNIKHSEQVAAEFRAVGISAYHVDGETDKKHREWIINQYRLGEIKILCNVGLFCAGFDVPHVGYIGMLRPTKSISLFLQQAGRGARPDDGKENYILCDHAGNIYQHRMLPHQDREWSLTGHKKSSKKSNDGIKPVAIKQCPKCYHWHDPAPFCPQCNHIYEIAQRNPKQEEGDLKKIDPEEFKKQRRIEVKKAQTLEDLENIGRERGYKLGWARIQWDLKNNGAGYGHRGIKYNKNNHAQSITNEGPFIS